MDINNITLELELQDALSDSCKESSSSIDAYWHFFWLFGCLFALSKFMELSERYVNAKIASKKRSCNMLDINDEWEKTLKLYEQDKIELDSQLQSLRERNCGLEQLMRDLRLCNLQLISENYMRTVRQDQQIQGLAQRVQDRQTASNIYINNRHIHLTRQVFLNEGTADLDANLGEPDLKSLNVWLQYLKMRKCYIGKLAHPELVLNGQPERKLPIVMTTEQMAKLQAKQGQA